MNPILSLLDNAIDAAAISQIDAAAISQIDGAAISQINARAFSQIDRIRIARVKKLQGLVWSRLHELNHEIIVGPHHSGALSSTDFDNLIAVPHGSALSTHFDTLIVVPQSSALSSTAFDTVQNAIVPTDAFLGKSSAYFTDAIFQGLLPKPDLRLFEERKALRRLLRLLNKVITIVLRQEAFDGSRRRIVFKLRAFFVVHGDRPPRSFLRHRLMPEACAA